MKTIIAFLRGINVGGANLLPMKELRTLLQRLGCEDVRTYIQSGNAVFRHPSGGTPLSKEIRAAIRAGYGFQPSVLLLSRDELERAAAENPFTEAEAEPKTLHLGFLMETSPAPDRELLEELRASDERYELTDSVFYLHAPRGVGRSKLAAKVDRALGVATTARNWRTIQKMLALAAS